MALTLGQLVSGAGAVGSSWRKEEEAQRVAQQNQLKIEEQNRLNRFRQNELQAQLPVQPPLNIQPGYVDNFGMEMVPIAAPAAPAAPAVPQVPVGGQAGTPMAAPNQFWDTRQPMSVVSGRQQPMPSAQQLRAGLTPDNIMTRAAKQPITGAINAGDMANLAFLDNAPALPPTKRAQAPDLTKVGIPEEQKGARRNLSTGVTVEPTAQPKVDTQQIIADPQVSNYFASLEQQNGLPQGVLAAIMDQESKGKAGLVSPAGAKGYFQFMDATAQQYGVTVNDLGSEAQGAARFLGDLYRKYGGDMTKVLAAYNWGQGNVDRKGVDKLPKETQNYIPAVLAKMGQAMSPVGTAEAATAVQPTIVPDTAAKVGELATPKEQKKIGDFYLTNPEAIPEDTARAMRQRNELVRLAQSYQNAGMGLEYTGVRAKIMELDESMFYLQGMQGLNDLALANDPRRLAAVWSRAKGQPIGIQPRSDGMYNVFINGNRLETPYSADDVSKAARATFDTSYVKQVTELQISQFTKGFEAQLDMAKENAKQLAQMIREVAVERVKGSNDQALQYMKDNFNWDIKPTGAGDGTVIIRAPGSAPVVYNPTGKTVEIDGVKITSNAATPIAGLPSYSGLPSTK
jgi:hypothetical protein